jgi:hypothetical protein
MERDLSFSNALGLPEELVPLLVDSWACEYASLKKNGTPITHPLLSFPGEDGRTIDITTGLAYPSKAERARNNPKVCLLYSDPIASQIENPPVTLVYGHATVYDSDLQANTDRYVQASLSRMKMFAQMPGFMLRWMRAYLARIWIAVTPLKVLWWPEGDMEKTPKLWRAPEGTQAPLSDPKPEPLSTPHKPWMDTHSDWRKEITYAFDKLGSPFLTVVDEEGYPVPFRVQSGSLQSDGVSLDISPAMPTDTRGRACLTFHSIKVKNGEMVSNDNKSFLGTMSEDGVSFKVKRQLDSSQIKFDLGGMLSFVSMIRRLGERVDAEAGRRGQPVPKIRLPGQY